VNKAAIEIGLDSFIDERRCSQPRPPLRVVPMVISNDSSAILSVLDVLENISG